MAFTVLATWDFRGAESASVKRDSRIGSYTLTESGTPTWSSLGVLCSGASDRLTLTLPSELKLTGDIWIMGGVTRKGSPTGFRNIFGYIQNENDNNAGQTFSLMHWSGDNALRYALSPTVGDGLYSVPLTTVDDEVTISLVRSGNDFSVYTDAASVASKTDSGTLQYETTSHLAIGPAIGTTGASNYQYHWLIIGSGTHTTGEATTILSDLDGYLYPAVSGGTSFLGINTGFIF